MPAVFNPYAGDDQTAAARRDNLALYLRRMAERRPRLLLVGEAPGYRGCRVTGVPFTSEAILLAEPSPFGLFGRSAGFRAGDEAGRPWREATATILWQTLAGLDALPLLWNAFPYHPHRPDAPDSNRPPTSRELALGREAVVELIDVYEIETVIAAGNKAAEALARWGIAARRVRHPGHGGKEAFGRELAAAISET
jgi:uracil-DNA glycosylase